MSDKGEKFVQSENGICNEVGDYDITRCLRQNERLDETTAKSVVVGYVQCFNNIHHEKNETYCTTSETDTGSKNDNVDKVNNDNVDKVNNDRVDIVNTVKYVFGSFFTFNRFFLYLHILQES